MPETTFVLSPNQAKAFTAAETLTEKGLEKFQPGILDSFNMPSNHEERLEWVRKSYERFFEKVRELDALMGLPELN